MIKALIFDLDGTLIQTEVLKAESYAKAIHNLSNGKVLESTVLEVFDQFVGLSREEVVKGLTEAFQNKLKQSFPDTNLEELKDRVISKRLTIYRHMLNDKALLAQHFCPFNMGLLQTAHADGFKTAVATMSHIQEATKVLDVMGLSGKLDLIVSRDDVINGKPDPEIYLKVQNHFKLEAHHCLVIEDSVNGIKAALAANMPVFAVTNVITKNSVHSENLLHKKFIIDDLTELKSKVYQFISERQKD